MRSDEAKNFRFSQATGMVAAGYDMAAVDKLIDQQIVPTLRAYEEGTAGIALTAKDLATVKLELTRKGYQVTEVDEFLDKATDQLKLYESV